MDDGGGREEDRQTGTTITGRRQALACHCNAAVMLIMFPPQRPFGDPIGFSRRLAMQRSMPPASAANVTSSKLQVNEHHYSQQRGQCRCASPNVPCKWPGGVPCPRQSSSFAARLAFPTEISFSKSSLSSANHLDSARPGSIGLVEEWRV